MTNTIKKTFAKRATDKSEGGTIAEVELTTPPKAFEGWKWNGEEIPPQSVEQIISTYFFQSLSDAYAGEKTIDTATAMFENKEKAMLAGTLGVRASGGVSTLVTVMRQLARKALRASVDAATYKASFSDLETAEQNEALDAIIEANESALKKAAEEEIAKRAAEQKAANALAQSIKI